MSLEMIPQERIERQIYLIRGKKVMLSVHLAELYGVEVRALVQAVRRNIERFPKDFMFQLNNKEFRNLKSQIVISSWGGARRSNPYAFTEQGVAMLSSVLNSKRAIHVNIQIMRTFIKLKEMISTYKVLQKKVEAMEKKYDFHFKIVFKLLETPEKQTQVKGFRKE